MRLASAGEIGDAESGERGMRPLVIVRAGGGEGAEMGGPAHQHEIEHRIGEVRLGLRDIGDRRARARPATGGDGPAVDSDLAGERRQQSEQRLEQRGLADAVGAEQAEYLAGGSDRSMPLATTRCRSRSTARRPAARLSSSFAGRAPAARRRPGRRPARSARRAGSRCARPMRASVSIATMKAAPSRMEAGSSRSKRGPTSRRAICGTISPIQPMTPEIATTLAVISVAAR